MCELMKNKKNRAVGAGYEREQQLKSEKKVSRGRRSDEKKERSRSKKETKITFHLLRLAFFSLGEGEKGTLFSFLLALDG